MNQFLPNTHLSFQARVLFLSPSSTSLYGLKSNTICEMSMPCTHQPSVQLMEKCSYITKFLWGQRRPPGDSEIEQSILSSYPIPDLIISIHYPSLSFPTLSPRRKQFVPRPGSRISIGCDIVHDLVIAVRGEFGEIRIVLRLPCPDRDFEPGHSIQRNELAVDLGIS